MDSLAGMDPVLTTERLVLRPATAGDHRVLLAHWTLPDVRRFMFDGALLSAAEVADTIGDSVRDFAAGPSPAYDKSASLRIPLQTIKKMSTTSLL